MAGLKNPTLLRHSSYNSHKEKNSDGSKENKKSIKISNFGDDKENVGPRNKNPAGNLENYDKKQSFLKPSLQFCIQMNEPETSFGFGFKVWDAAAEEKDDESAKSVNVWDFSDSEAAPVSSWSTLPNKTLLCRTLPMDVGMCTCIILKEAAPKGFENASIYSLFTNEGHGRQNRKLAVAYHKRRNGRSIFIISQNTKEAFFLSDYSFVGVVTSNLMGSRYNVWDQGWSPRRKFATDSRLLQAVVEFVPTVRTWTGSYRRIRAWIPKKQHPLQLKNRNRQVQSVKGLPFECEGNQVQQLLSKVPYYNKISKRHELDFGGKAKAGFEIQSSVKNFQLTKEENGSQTILQLGRIGKSKYVLDYRNPLTGYQAFCICLASIDPKLCCAV